MTPKIVSDQHLLGAFECLCKAYGVISAGFDLELITAPIDGDKYDGKTRWAMKHLPGSGWMIVCGYKGCGTQFTGWADYIKKRRNFLVFLNALANAPYVLTKCSEAESPSKEPR